MEAKQKKDFELHKYQSAQLIKPLRNTNIEDLNEVQVPTTIDSKYKQMRANARKNSQSIIAATESMGRVV